jgi:cell division protein FtsB
MAVGREMKRRLRAAVPPMIFLALTAYFAWNATQGDRGLQAYAQRQQMLHTAQDDLAKAEADRDGWERRAAALGANHLDPDMLDERTRAILNRTDPSDVVVLYPPQQRLF